MEYGTAEIKLYSKSEQIDIQKSISPGQHKFIEYSTAFAPKPTPPPNQLQYLWKPPPPGRIKINVDAAIAESHSALAAIARDCRGTVIKILPNTFRKSSPILAETHAVPRGVQLAWEKGWSNIIIENDAKNCLDPLVSADISPDWSISNVIKGVKFKFFIFNLLLFLGQKGLQCSCTCSCKALS